MWPSAANVAHFAMTPAIAMLRMIHTMFIDVFARREESRILRQHRRGCAEGDSGNRRLLLGWPACQNETAIERDSRRTESGNCTTVSAFRR
jgi:hypothetical protein